MTELPPGQFDATTAHGRPVADIAVALEVDPARGLAGAEAITRAATAGPNELEPERRPSVVSMVFDAATEPFVLLLAAA
ncbi:MAG: cation-transporting P-type ATPase, partial [Chloroflexota bacterium]